MHTVLMVAFHFPPAAMGSGHLRTLGFARYLPELGWKPIVLTAGSFAYPQKTPIQADLLPGGLEVHRAFAFDAGRHFAIARKYPGFIASPDRWASWWPAAVLQGLRVIRRRRVSAIWSTYPIMTAHCIAHTLSRLAKLPWIADFRDPVSASVGPTNRWSIASQRRWERKILTNATRVSFTTPGAFRDCADRYPGAASGGRITVIENGYDESAFVGLPVVPFVSAGRPLTLVHSGSLYRNGRDPLPFFSALAKLKRSGEINAKGVHVVLRACGSEALYANQLRQLAIGDLVSLAPPVPNREALVEQARADALLLFQGARFNRQIPAKLYEYFRIGKPLFALVDANGDTASLLRGASGAEVVPIGDADAIASRLIDFLRAVGGRQAPVIPRSVAERYSRRAGAVSLASLLDTITAGESTGPRVRHGSAAPIDPRNRMTPTPSTFRKNPFTGEHL